MVCVIQLSVEDIDAVIEAAKHYKYSEGRNLGVLNRLSSLPESKEYVKRAIKERIQQLAAYYVSLATFVPDDDADYAAGLYGEPNKKRVRRIFVRVICEMDRLEKEIREFEISSKNTVSDQE